MKIGSGAVLIVFALFVLYIGVSGKYDCFSGLFACLFPGRSVQIGSGSSVAPPKATASGSVGSSGGTTGSIGIPFPTPGEPPGGGCFASGGCGNPFDVVGQFMDFSF